MRRRGGGAVEVVVVVVMMTMGVIVTAQCPSSRADPNESPFRGSLHAVVSHGVHKKADLPSMAIGGVSAAKLSLSVCFETPLVTTDAEDKLHNRRTAIEQYEGPSALVRTMRVVLKLAMAS